MATALVDRPSADPEIADLADRTIPRGTDRQDDGPSPAVDRDVWELHVRYQRTRCPEALEGLVEEYKGYALALARRWHRDGEPLDDLRQVALEALVVALQRFDCERRTPFVGFATPTIAGALKRHFRDQGWALRVPRVVHEMAAPTREAADRLGAQLGRPATATEVAEELGIEEETVQLVDSATRARSAVSLDAPVSPGADTTWEIPTSDPELRMVVDRVALEEALQTLDERSLLVLRLYFFEDRTQTQIAEELGVSQMQISRWISSAVRRLRSRTLAEPAPGTDRQTVATGR